HSYCHPKMLWKNRKQIYNEIKYTDEILFKITGVRPTLFRPPYGRVGLQLLNVIKFTQHKIVLWSASTRDYRMRANPNTIQSKFNRCLRPGNIVLLHDGHRNSHNTLKGLEFSLAKLKHRNIKFSALPDTKTMEFRL
ncbi:MAG: polysaccharide deacetylase family protein, partial [bacterium]